MLTPVNVFSSNGVSTIFTGGQPLHSGVYHIVRTQPDTKHYATEAADTMIKKNYHNGKWLTMDLFRALRRMATPYLTK